NTRWPRDWSSDVCSSDLLVIDGSARLADTTERLVAALEAIPPGIKVGAIVAAEPTRSVPVAPWSDAQKRAVAKLLRSTSFVGGQDRKSVGEGKGGEPGEC